MEVFARQLFLRQRELDQERLRSDVLLLNILPQAVVDQLKASSGERIAEAFDDVSVIFVDAVGSTEQAARSSPEEFAAALDALFRWFDELADRHGLEKIKTIGDAYMAVAGAPSPSRPCRRGRRDGARDRRRVPRGAVAIRRPDQGAGGSPPDRSLPA
jgi:class 3 adenylate cyclase